MRTTTERDEVPGSLTARRPSQPDPARGAEQAILDLQRTVGNAAVERLLTGSSPGPDVQRQGADALTVSRAPSGGGDTSAVPVDAPSTSGTATLKAPGLVDSLPLSSVSVGASRPAQRGGRREEREEREEREVTQITITFESGRATVEMQKAMLNGKVIETATVEMAGMKLELKNVLISSLQMSSESGGRPSIVTATLDCGSVTPVHIP
jgi:Type VI secretion system effector, Hcp